MHSLFFWCALIAGSIFAFQFLMLIIGLETGNEMDFDAPEMDVPELDVSGFEGDLEVPELETPDEMTRVSLKEADADFDKAPDSFDHSDGWFVGIVTFRSMVAAIAVFGLTGLEATKHLPPEKALALACLSGFGMLYLVGWSFRKIYLLQADGTVKMQDAVGCSGTVYLTIPANHEGAGKVTVKVAERTMEYRAMTKGDSLKTGTPIVVTKVISEDTLEVQSNISAGVASGESHHHS